MTLVVMPEVLFVLATVTAMVVVTVLVLMRVAVTGFEVMVGVARWVLVVAGVGWLVKNNVRIVKGCRAWCGRERRCVNAVWTGDGAVVAVGGGVGGT
jgi:hypothetical protein